MTFTKSFLQCISLTVICTSPALASEKVTLKNGKVFTVDTSSNGMPFAAKSDKTSGVTIAPIIAPARGLNLAKPIQGKVAILWMFAGNLTATGSYKVVVSSPVDDSISGSFDAQGPGKFYFQGVEKSEVPAAWAWIDEPGDSWIALTLTFTDKASKQSFQLTQWHRSGSNQKAAVKGMIRKLEAE